MAAREAMTSVSCGPMKLETRNWKKAKAAPRDQDCGPDLEHRGESAGDEDEIGREEERDGCADACRPGAEGAEG